MKKKVIIISNEKFYAEEKNYFCDNIAEKSLPDGLKDKFEVTIIGRSTYVKRAHQLKTKNIESYKFLISYLIAIFKKIRKEETKFLILAISPYTFIVSIFLRILGKKPIVYLRSDGFGEYKSILGKIGPAIYYLMFSITCSISNLISCKDYILRGKKGKIISPSQLDSTWLRHPKKTDVRNFKLLYVGRLKVEKGIFSLIDLIKNKKDISLTVVGAEKGVSHNLNQSNVKIFQQQSNKLKLIKYYDDNNIFILPSFTEGHPMVLLEALARRRPVIIFEDIEHVIGDKKGVFVSKRNFVNLLGTLNHIKKNYKKIQNEMRKNKLPTYKEFINKFGKLIDEF